MDIKKEVQILLAIRKFTEEKRIEEEKYQKYFNIYFNIYIILLNKLKMDNLIKNKNKINKSEISKIKEKYVIENNNNNKTMNERMELI